MKQNLKVIFLIVVCFFLSGCYLDHEHYYERTTTITENLNDDLITVKYKCMFCFKKKTEKIKLFSCLMQENQVKVVHFENDFKKDLEKVRIPDTYEGKPVTIIGEKLFENSENLNMVIIPKTIKEIQEGTFYGCPSLETIYYEGTLEDWCNIKIELRMLDKLASLKHVYMKDDNNEYYELKELVIPETITKIGQSAFAGFSSLTKLILHDNITKIGDCAFYLCENITDIIMPHLNDYNYTKSEIFGYNKVINLTLTKGDYIIDEEEPSSTGGNNLSKVKGVFSTFEFLETITMPQTITSIGSYAFLNCKNLTSIVIPNDVTKINKGAFMNCTNLQTFTFSKNTKAFGEKLFDGCENLKDVYFDGNIEDWCNISFESSPGCYSKNLYFKNNNEYEIITEIIIPETITEIGKYQFAGFNEATNITIPSTVTSIGDQAFYNCVKLKKIFLDLNIEYIGYNVFENCDKVLIYCEHKSKPTAWDKDWCKGKYCYWDYKALLGKE